MGDQPGMPPAKPSNEYGHAAPTERDLLESLADLVGLPAAERIWDLSARDLGMSRPVTDPAQLLLMVEHMMNVGDLVRVAGRSAKVNLVTYEALNRS